MTAAKTAGLSNSFPLLTRRPLRVAIVTSEASPLKTTGGLGHATTGLAQALSPKHAVDIIVPRHNQAIELAISAAKQFSQKVVIEETAKRLDLDFGGKKKPASIYSVSPVGTSRTYYLIDSEDGRSFGNREVYGYPDDAERYLYYCMAAAKLIAAIQNNGGKKIDAVQTNDWATAYIGYYLRHCQYEKQPYTPLTHVIHNLGYSNGMSPDNFARLTGEANPWAYDQVEGLNFHGQMDPTKAGIIFADKIIAVSPTYAREILSGQTPSPGDRYAGLLQKHGNKLTGILNGINPDYGPGKYFREGHLAANFNPTNLKGKKGNLLRWQRLSGLNSDPAAVLAVATGRWADQKGTDMLLAALPGLLSGIPDFQFSTVGSESRGGHFRAAFMDLANRYPGRVSVIDFDPSNNGEGREALLLAAGTIMLMPSHYEPCGLADLYSLAMGTPVIANRTGGLADAIRHRENGFLMNAVTVGELYRCISHALNLRSNPSLWQAMQINAMSADHSWTSAAQNYEDVFYELAQ